MEHNNDKKALVQSSFTIMLATVLTIIALYIPIISFMIIMLPVPFVILGSRYGIKYAILTTAAYSLLISFLTNILISFFAFILLAPIVIVLSYLIKVKTNEFEVIAFSTAASVLSFVIFVSMVSWVLDIQLIDEIGVLLRDTIYNQLELFENVNINSIRIEESINYFMAIIPALLVVQSMSISFINYFVSIDILKKTGYYKGSSPRISSFKLPKNILVGFLILLGLSYLTRLVDGGIYYADLVSNILVIFVFLIYTQGITVLIFFMNKHRFNRYIKILLIVLAILFVPFSTFIAFIGFLDIVFDMRKLNKKKD
ncbi:DUF2232 domain-containing protein [Serpentinicella sp. ANB-PHB4]|uniref:YybS family protein n=1 Tax=Serpentinicella sp. ANB-PHB4 TaxID=3074076 RepID=UPI0028580C52|nr:DUF2232 domain-containing protein [Serpentinicella sp. ANB-PHB4]MDR5658881.1 DUF2232 domain-containing protein [Serpentinicella sp. ANB-PHB4]